MNAIGNPVLIRRVDSPTALEYLINAFRESTISVPGVCDAVSLTFESTAGAVNDLYSLVERAKKSCGTAK